DRPPRPHRQPRTDRLPPPHPRRPRRQSRPQHRHRRPHRPPQNPRRHQRLEGGSREEPDVTARHAAAICCWLIAWWFAGLIVVAWLAARAGKTAVARAELA